LYPARHWWLTPGKLRSERSQLRPTQQIVLKMPSPK
jgi:hypothetical protein